MKEEKHTQHGKSCQVERRRLQQVIGDDQTWPVRMEEGPVVPRKPGNAGGGKGPWFRINA